MPGEVKLVPVPIEVPPVGAEYQLIVPALAVASKVTVPVSQREPSVVPVIVGMVLTVTDCCAGTVPPQPPVIV